MLHFHGRYLRGEVISAQTGFALILSLLFLTMLVSAWWLPQQVQWAKNQRLVTQQQQMQRLLATKQAILAFVRTNGLATGGGSPNNQRAGNLLFPDGLSSSETPRYNYNGAANSGCIDVLHPTSALINNQTMAMRCIGRLPWLGKQANVGYRGYSVDLRLPPDPSEINLLENDPAGMVPWYAVSPNLLDSDCLTLLNPSILTWLQPPTLHTNAVQCGQIGVLPWRWLRVVDASGGLITDRAAVVLIAPNAPLAGQQRVGATPGRIGDFLEAENAALIDTFVSQPWRDAGGSGAVTGFNDQLVYITIDEIMQAAQQRVAEAIINELQQFWWSNGYLPDVANDAAGVCAQSTMTVTRVGFLPLSVGNCLKVPTWKIADWLSANQWFDYVRYAVAGGCRSLTPVAKSVLKAQPNAVISCAGLPASLALTDLSAWLSMGSVVHSPEKTKMALALTDDVPTRPSRLVDVVYSTF
jgi:hypothetical protein